MVFQSIHGFLMVGKGVSEVSVLQMLTWLPNGGERGIRGQCLTNADMAS